MSGQYMESADSDVFVYRIDRDDRITYVNRSWEAFAAENGGFPDCTFANIQGKPIWPYLSGSESRMIYTRIFERARTTGKTLSFRLHCDSIETIRVLHASVIPLPEDALEVRFSLVEEKERDPAAAQAIAGMDQGIISMCSYCGNLQDKHDEWRPVEVGVSAMDLFGFDELPKISHGICPACREGFLDSLREELS
ncbi:MAG TPA: hypothetical protein VJ961_06320 [Mariprofundaceae bacterium]|nr:hypothetical protein [Mariprofundaceae bacterium]